MGNAKCNVSGIMDDLDNVMMYIRLCQSAIGNKNYLELYPDIECILGDINDRLQNVIEKIEEISKKSE